MEDIEDEDEGKRVDDIIDEVTITCPLSLFHQIDEFRVTNLL